MYGGRALRIAVGITMLVLLVAGEAGATKSINNNATGGDCTSIGTWNVASKTCTLTTDLTETIEIDSDGITLSGNGHTITGSSTGNGIYLSGRNGVTIKNMNVWNFIYGIYLSFSSNNTLSGNNASNNSCGIWLQYSSNNNTLSGNIANSNHGYGIVLDPYSNNNTLSGNTANSNYFEGISLMSSNNTLNGNNVSNNEYGVDLGPSSINKIYNNFFNNTNNFYFYGGTPSNIWNIATKTPGMNIIGGPYLGGNFWSNQKGNGFSETCTDSNNDGICDQPYILDSSNIDYLPLAYQPVARGNITGTVTNASSTLPIANAEVTAGSMTATTNAIGIYTMSIAPGLHSVTASAAGYMSNTTSVTVISGATATRDFALQAAGKGDCSGDGKMDIVDALFIAQSTVGLRTFDPAQSAAADVSGDGAVNIVDALFIAQATVGLRVL